MFPETETTKDSSYSWKQQPYKASYISENGTLTRKLEKIKNPSRKKNSYSSGNGTFFYTLDKIL